MMKKGTSGLQPIALSSEGVNMLGTIKLPLSGNLKSL